MLYLACKLTMIWNVAVLGNKIFKCYFITLNCLGPVAIDRKQIESQTRKPLSCINMLVNVTVIRWLRFTHQILCSVGVVKLQSSCN